MVEAARRTQSNVFIVTVAVALVASLLLGTLNASAATTTALVSPTLDTQVKAASPNRTYINSNVAYTQQNEYLGLFRFDTTSALAGGQQASAVRFEPYINHTTTSTGVLDIYSVSDSWDGDSTWNSTAAVRSQCSGTPVASLPIAAGGARVSIALPLSVISGNGSVNICASTSDVTGGQVRIATMEDGSGNVPHLAIDTEQVDTTAPSIPSGLSATLNGTDSANLQWTESTDNFAVTGYRIVRNGTVVATTASSSYLDANLEPEVTYSYQVRAFDADGNTSLDSSTASVTTPAAPVGEQPSTVMNLDDLSITDSSSWAVSNVTEGVRWTNQDRTNQNTHVYAVGPDGKTVATVTMTGSGVTNVDPEAAATSVVNGTPYVYVSDAGGNKDKRDTISLHRFAEIELNTSTNGQLIDAPAQTWTFTYPVGDVRATRTAGPDSEALLVNPVTGQVYIVTKSNQGLTTGATEWGVYEAPLAAADTPGSYALTKVATHSFKATDATWSRDGSAIAFRTYDDVRKATDATWSRDGSAIAFRTYDDVRLYEVQSGDVAAALATSPLIITTISQQQSEGVAFSADGLAVELSTEQHNGVHAPVVRQPLPPSHTVAPISLVDVGPVDPEPEAGLVATGLGSGSSAISDTTFQTGSVSPAVDTAVVLYVSAGRTDGTATIPTTISGLGTTWQLIASSSIASGNLASAAYISDGAATAGTITATFPGAQQSFLWHAVQLDTEATRVAVNQVATYSGADATPSAVFSQSLTSGSMTLGFIASNSTSQTIDHGVNYIFIGSQVGVSGPSVRSAAAWSQEAQGIVDFVTSGRNQKTVLAIELSRTQLN